LDVCLVVLPVQLASRRDDEAEKGGRHRNWQTEWLAGEKEGGRANKHAFLLKDMQTCQFGKT